MGKKRLCSPVTRITHALQRQQTSSFVPTFHLTSTATCSIGFPTRITHWLPSPSRFMSSARRLCLVACPHFLSSLSEQLRTGVVMLRASLVTACITDRTHKRPQQPAWVAPRSQRRNRSVALDMFPFRTTIPR